MRRIMWSLVLGCVAGAAAAADGNAMQPGQWEYKVKMEMPGMPMAMPAQTFSQCLTQKDVESGAVAQDSKQKSDCEVKNLKQSGGSVSYDIVCKGKQPMTGHADFTVSANTLVGAMTMDMDGQAMKQNFSAKRLGDCAK